MATTGKAEIRALMLRLPKSLHRLLTQGAKKADRSLNAEIVRRLELSFGVEEDRRRVAEDDLVKLAEEHSRKARELQVHITAHLLARTQLTPAKGPKK